MRLHIWVHAQSFAPESKTTDLLWLEEYEMRLKELGVAISRGYSLDEAPEICNWIQVMGQGHFEIIPYLTEHYSAKICFFPFSPTGFKNSWYQPETKWKERILSVWRKWAFPNLLQYTGSILLNRANMYCCFQEQKNILLNWRIQPQKINTIPANPVECANQMRKIFV